MRVAHLVPSFSPLSETFIYSQISGIQAAGVPSTVLTYQRVSGDARDFPDVRVLRPSSRLLRFVDATTALGPNCWAGAFDSRGLYYTLQKLKPDALWAHFGPTAFDALFACRNLGIPVIASFHGRDAYAPSFLHMRKYRAVFHAASVITAVTHAMARRLIEIGAPPAKVVLLGVGVDLPSAKCADPSNRFDGQTIHVLQVGRMVPKKDPLTALRALVIAQKGYPEVNFRLTLIGDGPLFRQVKDARDALGLTGSVDLPGEVPHREVLLQMERSHIYMQTSAVAPDGDKEGLPVAVLEAAARGVPIVATRHSGIPEFVTHGSSGLLAEERDAQGLGAHLQALARTPESWGALGRAARAAVELDHDLVKVSSAALDLLRGVQTR